jgi:phosphoserine phosphatase
MPLELWNEGLAKSAILDFVKRVTDRDGPDFVPIPERIAVFDNDGTLWSEFPMQTQVFFLFDRLHQLAEVNPTLKDDAIFSAFFSGDNEKILALGKEGILKAFAATHAGMTEEAFGEVAQAWLKAAKHPDNHRLFANNVYQPQLELLEYLRENGFKTFIVSGGGLDLIRAFSEAAYGIPPEHVIGSSFRTELVEEGDGVTLTKTGELQSFDDRETKVVNIGLHIGRRPILVAGNSDGDFAMMRYALAGKGPSLALLVHHDDGEREFVYDRQFKLSALNEALDRADELGIKVISMKRDWQRIYP